MVILIFFAAHWYVSLFFQSFFNHRYAAHRMFTMSTFWERVFYVFSWLTNGSSYLSPRAYAIMHRMHHAYADTEKDPHSPKFARGLMDMMWKTKNFYSDIFRRRMNIEPRFLKNLPSWDAFDKIGESWVVRLLWVGAYFAFYWYFATAWWQWLFFPLTVVVGPLHGAIINYFAHKIGYTNFKVSDTSRNLMPVDIFMMGEGYHNNHHKRGSNPNFGYRWYELDPTYPFVVIFNALGIIRLVKTKKKNQNEPDLGNFAEV